MTTQTTINGLHRCQPKNEPQIGAVKTFLVIHNPAKQGKKPWIAIKSAAEDKGGTPYRVVSIESTGWEPDQYGNQSYNLEVEAVNGNAFQQTKAAMKSYPGDGVYDEPQGTQNAPESPVHAQQGEDGVMATRKHLMQSANLLVLCIRAVENAVAPHQPVVAQTSEQFQSDVAKLFIEASSRRTTDGVNWWSYVDRMPDTPLAPSQSQQGKSGSTASLYTKNDCTCENTDGDNPLCPIHSS